MRHCRAFIFCFLTVFIPVFGFDSQSDGLMDFMTIPPELSDGPGKTDALFRFFSGLSEEEQKQFLKQLSDIDPVYLEMQTNLVHSSLIVKDENFYPFEEFTFAGNADHREYGEELIREGKVGCLLLAGGQGTRLKIQGPKGCYPVSVVKEKSLFQLIMEKVKAASAQAGVRLHIAVMTSPDNDRETREFFEKNDRFGLDSEQVDFFVQTALPFLDKDGNLFLEKPSTIARGPDGNGYSLIRFAEAGILEKWKEKGIEYLHVIPVDNPLADPFDPELLGFHVKNRTEISMKCTEKTRPDEKVGVLVKTDNGYRVIEYSELSSEEQEARRDDGKLKHCCANLGLFCFSLRFIDRIRHDGCLLPLHKAWKSAKRVNEKGTSETTAEPSAWKFETFIFDWLQFTEKVGALIDSRAECFSPIKNFSGPDSPETARAALIAKDRRTIEKLTGLAAPNFLFELDSAFYYPDSALTEKWKGKSFETNYLEP